MVPLRVLVKPHLADSPRPTLAVGELSYQDKEPNNCRDEQQPDGYLRTYLQTRAREIPTEGAEAYLSERATVSRDWDRDPVSAAPHAETSTCAAERKWT